MTAERDVDLLVRTRQLQLSFRRLPLAIGLAAALPLVFAWLMRPLFSETALVTWMGVLWLSTLLRGVLWYAWQRTGTTATDIRRWAIAFWAVSTVAALSFSAGAVVLLVDAGSREAMMLATMMFAVAALGSGLLTSHLPSASTFVMVILVPTATMMLAKTDPVVRICGLAVLAGTGGLLASVVRAYREMDSLIRTELRLSAAVAAAVQARGAAEAASVAKSEFLANMSHELKTPLNAILGYSEMLTEDALAAHRTDTAADLGRITDAGRHLLALITNVLDLSRIEAGRMALHVDTVDASAVVRQVVERSAALAEAGGNRLTVEGVETLGTLQSDAVKLQQVLVHLVGNACKFTSNGTVHLECRRERTDADAWLVIDVNDSGIGMTAEQVGRLFTQFMQADSSNTRRFGGTGLGLAISQRLCHQMGGTITADSQFGRGSTFTLRLPVVAPDAAAGDGSAVSRRPATDRAPSA